MGTHTDGILAYGYDFGDEEEINLVETECGYLKTSWHDGENEGPSTRTAI